MKTPFDTVVRLRQREIDQRRIAIHAQTSRLNEIEAASDALQQELAVEYEASADQWSMSAEAFMRRKMSHQVQLAAQCIAVSKTIRGLRREATEAFGAMQVVQNAADGFRSEWKRNVHRAEQRASDDLGAVRLARIRSAKERSVMLRQPAR